MFALSATVRQSAEWHGDAEELRMLRAIAGSAVAAALDHGEYGAAFHGFRIHALRCVMRSGVCVALTVTDTVAAASGIAASCTMICNADGAHE
jgi:hypothetical protein